MNYLEIMTYLIRIEILNVGGIYDGDSEEFEYLCDNLLNWR
jgi:hypothetical protein